MTDQHDVVPENVWEREEATYDSGGPDRQGVAVYYQSLSFKLAMRDYEGCILTMPPGSRILEIGCGEGQDLVRFLSAGLRPLGTDISRGVVAQARTNLKAAGHDPGAAIQMNAEVLDFPENSFDMVCGRSILHHLTDLPRMAERVNRVLRPGGSCIFLEPLGHNPGLGLYRWLTPHVRTKDEHPLRYGDIRAFFAPFGRRNLRFYILCGLVAGAAYFITRCRTLFRILDALTYPLDRLVLAVPGPHRYLAFACVLQARKRQ